MPGLVGGVDRRAALMTALFGALAAGSAHAQDRPADQPAGHDMAAMPPGWVKADQIAMLCYPGMTILDLIGPQYMFAALMGASVHLVGKTRAPMTSDTGVTILPTATFDECPRDLTVLFVPGGTAGTLAAMQDAETRAFVADRGGRAQYVTSVCTGALVLGAAGLLKGYRATTHWAALETLADCGATPVSERVVRDRNRITGAGVTAGLDFGLSMVAELRDPVYAQGVQLGCEYDPQPPFNAGSTRTAPADVTAIMASMYAGFPGQVRAALKAAGVAR
ncbi:DJ-1/PfpI family protein [Sphingomonas changnyeongensis]|uniref:DJ-1/PfpI family protein n=2 Tax=Sphingomonas changnyeongensis TaxID=2698679 RepID=A0A7Z2S696_9SPHN|nr:DJ-1/PfpI family protein [Sphingomonas changnyeongensis]